MVIFNFLRKLHTVFHSDCTTVYSHLECTRVRISPPPLQNLLFSTFFHSDHLRDMRCYLIVVLICIYDLKISDVQNLSYNCLLSVYVLWRNAYLTLSHILIGLFVTLLLKGILYKLFFFLIYLFMAVLCLRFCARAFSSCGKWGSLFIAVHGPLIIAASLVVEHRLQTRRLNNCGSRAQLLRGIQDLPRPGLEPVSPALAGRFSTTASPGKPHTAYFN